MSSLKTILVVDDVEVNRLIAQRMLERLNYATLWTRDGIEAVEMLQVYDVDLILMDCSMPRCDGLEATRRIRCLPNAAWAEVAIVGLTASASEESRSECMSAGMNAVIHKPISFELLTHCVAEQLSACENIVRVAELSSVSAALIDVKVLDGLWELALPTDSEPFVDSLVRVYLTECPTLIEHLSRAFQNQDESQMVALAHKIKGLSRNIGAGAVAEICAGIENDAVHRGDRESPKRLLSCLWATKTALLEYQFLRRKHGSPT